MTYACCSIIEKENIEHCECTTVHGFIIGTPIFHDLKQCTVVKGYKFNLV